MIRTRALAVAVVAIVALAAAPAALAVPPAPAAPDLVATSDTGTSQTDDNTMDSTPTFTVTAGAAQAGMNVTLYSLAGTTRTILGVATADGTGVATVTTGVLNDGTYKIVATTANGLQESSDSASLTVLVDNVAPSLALAPRLVDFIGFTPGLTFTSTPRFDVPTTTDNRVDLYELSIFLGTGLSVDGTARVTVTKALGDGAHTVYALATDPAGNVSLPSPSATITVDTQPPPVSAPDLIDDDGASGTDDYTSAPRPRFSFTTEASARVSIYESGISLGSATAGSSGSVTVQVTESLWLDPGLHCIYAIAMDAVGNTTAETSELCITIGPGTAPFTTNLGLALTPDTVTISLRPTVAARASIKVLRGGKTVLRAQRSLPGGTATRIRLRLPKAARSARKLTVVTTLRSADGRTLVLRRLVRR